MPVTIKQIAAIAGVSRGTVDRALHNRKGVKPERAQDIIKLADEMGYRPDRAGKILAAKKKPIVVGCLIPSIGNDFYNDIIKGLKMEEAALSDFGISLIIKEIQGYDEQTHLEGINWLLERDVQALCLSTLDVTAIHRVINDAYEKGIVTVTVNTDITNTKRLCYIGSNYLESGKTAGGMFSFLAEETSNLLVATGSMLINGHNQRVKGFLNQLQNKKVNYNILKIIETQDNDLIAYEKTIETLSSNTEINSIFIAAAGAFGVCRAAKALNRHHSMIIMAFDAVPSTVKLIEDGTINFTICQEPIVQGRMAINTLFNFFMKNRKSTPKSFFTQTVIKIKENL